jgi:hypothetical protein
MPDMQDRKVWKVWGWEVWPPEDYDAIYKIAPVAELETSIFALPLLPKSDMLVMWKILMNS